MNFYYETKKITKKQQKKPVDLYLLNLIASIGFYEIFTLITSIYRIEPLKTHSHNYQFNNHILSCSITDFIVQ